MCCVSQNLLSLKKLKYLFAWLAFLDPPKILRVTPGGGATIGVHNTSILTCSAEGNPLPKYLWLQKLPSNQILKRGYEDKLVIEDTSYDHQGEYVCEAVNVIGDQKKSVQSEPIRMEVRGNDKDYCMTDSSFIEIIGYSNGIIFLLVIRGPTSSSILGGQGSRSCQWTRREAWNGSVLRSNP